ncbi:SDR family oxidoreductase [Allokutzneria albata]|uniref:dTDP-4-dehydrorhamnose reductase n=1 Tax=Allokutzneria albata TaxID=211114 RepID=A0A1G9REU3_ALLAB|nr:SDR family oxidoreductase [Allokutzneria albata]SDM21590.1 dTDP-4-dehydrorhamnose reductase [Allokutzneria albata]
MTRVLITGATGLLGAAVRQRLEAAGHTVTPCHHNKNSTGERLDITSAESVSEVFGRTEPEIVVHCAAIPDVAQCEKDPERARLVNVTGTELVAQHATRVGARLVHVSTDWVFAGDGEGDYRETDTPTPAQEYGRSKLAAEQTAAEAPSTLIVRVPLLYGLGTQPRPTWPAQVLGKLGRGEEVRADDEEIRQPALVDDVARCFAELVSLHTNGIVHIAPAETHTKLAWSRLLAEAVGAAPDLIRLTSRPEWPNRPLRATLRADRLAELGVTPPRGAAEVATAHRKELADLLT